jgi:magnesium transporter
MPHSKSSSDTLHDLLSSGDTDGLCALIRELPPGESARLVTRLDRDQQRQLLTLLPAAEAAQVLKELALAQAAQMLPVLSPERAAALVELLPSNEQADLLAELGEDAAPILASLSAESAERVQRLSRHRPDSAGGLMVAEFLAYCDGATVGDVIEDLRSHAAAYTRMHAQYAYVTDDAQRLIGVLRLRDLLLLERDASVRQAMTPEPRRVRSDISLDELARFFDRYSFFAVPVVDADGRLLGIVLRVDVEEATSERADRRMLLMSGILEGEESRSMSWTSRVLRRAPWLVVSLVLSLAAASVIGWYQETLAVAIALAVFLPVISGMGGNSGNQALAVSIRELSLGLVQPQEILWVVLKEISVGLTNGLFLGLAVATICFAWQRNIRLSVVVGAAIALNTLVAACLGGILPLLLKKCRLDPALASGPVLAAVNDLCGFLFALVLADLLLPHSLN